VVICIFVMYIYSQQRRLSLKLNRKVLKVSFTIAVLFWCLWSGGTVLDWDTSYQKALVNVNNLISAEREPQKRMVIIGNPGRYKQTLMFDKMTGAYNFWKNKKYIINDTINDVIQSAAFQESSIGAEFEVKEISSTEFEIRCKAPRQFFYIEGYNSERIRTGFRNKDISVEFTEFNNVDKPIRLTLRILSSEIECFVAGGLGFRKIF
ncbi:MAG TPA: hypothetical protein VG961_05425, partial [Ignavibacteria bacterium]|nr:hypothetical protein [Ignavibacteria bacterium]